MVDTGYGTDELLRLLGAPPEKESPPPMQDLRHVQAASKVGQIWKLGDHYLAVGDSTDPELVGRLMEFGRPNLMVTDPPYGVNYDTEWRTKAGLQVPNDRGLVTNDDRADWSAAYELFPGDIAYVWHAAGALQVAVYHSLVASDFEPRQYLIWRKSQAPISRAHYHYQHEPCWYSVRKGRAANWKGDRKQTSVWDIDKPHRQETGHATQKPVECMLIPILNHTDPGDWVYDPFCGSGTTIIAAEQSGRRCLAVELEPAFADIIIQRWATESGGTPELLK